MIVTIPTLKHVTLQVQCPHCKAEEASDFGTCRPADLKDKVVHCSACGEPYNRTVDWGAALNHMIRNGTLTYDSNGNVNANAGQSS